MNIAELIVGDTITTTSDGVDLQPVTLSGDRLLSSSRREVA